MSIADASRHQAARPQAPPAALPSPSRPPGWSSGSAPPGRWPGWTGGRPGHRVRAARAERRGQDHHGADPRHPARPRWRHGPGWRAMTWRPSRRGAPPDRAGRAVRHRGRGPDRAGEPRATGLLAGLGRRARARAAELLAAFGLGSPRPGRSRPTPGGCAAASTWPPASSWRAEVYFLDEPTTGLDPASRAQVHQIIRSLAAGGATVLLTTQYLDEADQLAGRIAVIDHGTVIAEGTTGELKASAGSGTLRIRLADPAQRPPPSRYYPAAPRARPGRGRPGALTATIPAAPPGGRPASRRPRR